MYFLNANGKVIKTKHLPSCKCQYCHRVSSKPSHFSTFLMILILMILFYYIWCFICKMKKNDTLIPQTTISSTPPTITSAPADGGSRVNYLL
jgi:hypothetical protein